MKTENVAVSISRAAEIIEKISGRPCSQQLLNARIERGTWAHEVFKLEDVVPEESRVLKIRPGQRGVYLADVIAYAKTYTQLFKGRPRLPENK